MTFSSKMFRCKWQLILYAACSLYSSTLPFAVEANGSISGETSNDGFYLRHHGTVHEAGSSFHRVAPAKPREHFEDVTLSPRLPRRHHQNQHQTENIKQKDESPVNPAKVWAVLVAGSNGYFNYRHQVRSTNQSGIVISLYISHSTYTLIRYTCLWLSPGKISLEWKNTRIPVFRSAFSSTCLKL